MGTFRGWDFDFVPMNLWFQCGCLRLMKATCTTLFTC